MTFALLFAVVLLGVLNLLKGNSIMDEIEALRAEVAADTAVTTSAVTLINGLVEKLSAIPNPQPELTDVIAQLTTNREALAAAVAAGTPADPAADPAAPTQ